MVRTMLSDRCTVRPLLSFLPVTLVYCGQTVRWINMNLGTEVGHDPGHTVLDRNPTPPKRADPQFSAHVCSVQTAEWIKMPLGT